MLFTAIYLIIIIIAEIWAIRNVFSNPSFSRKVKIIITIGLILTSWVGVIIYAILRKTLSGGKNSNQSDRTKTAWDFTLNKETVLQYLERYYNYYENKFYRSNDWPNIYRLDDNYKETILAPFRELLNYDPDELEFIKYENDDFYIGQIDGNGNPHGIGLYHWAREKDAEGDKHNEMFVGRWNHGQQTNDGSQIHASDETKTWFEACREGFRLAPIYGLRK